MITCRLITEVVSAAYEVSIRDLYSQRRTQDLILPRHMSWYLAKTLTSKSYPEIGRLMGGREHTTILHGVRRMGEEVIADPHISANFESLVRQIATLSAAAERNEHLDFRLDDLDPLETAALVLDAQLSEIEPSQDEIRAVCMGVRYYAAEFEMASYSMSVQLNSIRHLEAERDQMREAAKVNVALAEAARKVAAASKAHADAFDTSNERPARKALEAAISNLQTVFERTSNAKG